MAKKRIDKTSNKEKIKQLSEENKRLKGEVELLKSELEKATGKKAAIHPHDPVISNFDRQSLNTKLYSKKSYSAYLIGLISNTSVFHIYRKIISFFKKFTLVSVTLQLLAFVLTAIQSSAVFIVALSLFTISLPVTFIVGYTAIVFAFFGGVKRMHKIRSLAEGKDIVIFFPPKSKAISPDSFFAGMAREYAKAGKLSIIVSPYFLSFKGVRKSKRKKPFLSARIEEENLLIIRRHYFFTLKRKLLKKTDKNVTLIY